jgi:hypothetical protein
VLVHDEVSASSVRVLRPGEVVWFRGLAPRAPTPLALYVWHVADERLVRVAERVEWYWIHHAFERRGLAFIESAGDTLRFYDVDADVLSAPLASDVLITSRRSDHLLSFRVESEDEPERNGLYFASDR